MTSVIPEMVATEASVDCAISATFVAISSVARAVCVARLFTSVATTAKPRPASPARAASMVALRASKFVCPAMLEMRPTISRCCPPPPRGG